MCDFMPFVGEDKHGLFLANPYDDMSKATCDIICVHGLHGGTAKTWRHPDTNTIWFQDLLPHTIRRRVSGTDARIWTYGYPATVFLQDFNLRVQAENLLSNVKEIRRGHENKKIIWICHSLGGILVKQALINAKLNNHFQSIGNNTVGVVFLGTPHRGAGAADLGNIAATIAACVVPGIKVFNPAAVRNLKKNNDTLFQMAGQFSNVCSDITIHSFHETMPVSGTRLVVSHQSAILQIRNEVKTYGLTANHKEMVRFRNDSDPNWRQVSSSICDLMLLTVGFQAPARPIPNQTRTRSRPSGPQPQPSQPTRPPMTYAQPNPPSQSSSSYSGQPGSQVPRGLGSNSYFEPSWQQPPNRQGATGNGNPQVGSNRSPQSHIGERQRSSYSSFNSQHSKVDLRGEYLTARTSYTGSSSTAPGSASSSSIFTPPSISEASATGSDFDDPKDAEKLVAYCDILGCTTPGTLHPIKGSDTWAKCTVCDDYDLCLKCYQSGKKDKDHQLNHKVSLIRATRSLEPENLTQANEAVNPQVSNPSNPQRVNWVVSETKDPTSGELKASMTLRLFSGNSHARFISDIRCGHYAVWMYLDFKFSVNLSPESIQGGNGSMRVSIGHVRSQREFRRTKYAEDEVVVSSPPADSLPRKLFHNFTSQVFKMPIGDIRYCICFDTLLHMPGDSDSLPDIGVILQWSGAREFSRTDPEAVVEVSIDNIGLGDVLNYDDPFTCATPRNVPQQVGSARRVAAAPAPSSTGATEAGDDDDEDASLEDFIAAFNHVIQEIQDEQEKKRQQAIIMERMKQQQDEAKKLLIMQALTEAIQEQQREERAKELARQKAEQLRQQQLRARQQQANQGAQFLFFTTGASASVQQASQARQRQLLEERQRQQAAAALRQRQLQQQRQEAEAAELLAALFIASSLR